MSTIRYQRTLTVESDLSREALMELARDAWHDERPLWAVDLDNNLYPFDPPPAEVTDADVARCANALVDRFGGLDLFAARDYALTVLYALTGRCSDCGRVLDAHEGPQCAGDRAMAGLM